MDCNLTLSHMEIIYFDIYIYVNKRFDLSSSASPSSSQCVGNSTHVTCLSVYDPMSLVRVIYGGMG